MWDVLTFSQVLKSQINGMGGWMDGEVHEYINE